MTLEPLSFTVVPAPHPNARGPRRQQLEWAKAAVAAVVSGANPPLRPSPSDFSRRAVGGRKTKTSPTMDDLARVLTTPTQQADKSEGPVGREAVLPRSSGRHQLLRDCRWSDRYGWRPSQRPTDLARIESEGGTMRFRLLRDGQVRFVLELDSEGWRSALGSYAQGEAWLRHGYVTRITRTANGRPTEDFNERWAPHVRAPRDDEL